MFLLALDTSGNAGSIALLKDDQVLEELSWQAATHTPQLPSHLISLLKSHEITVKKIDAYALTIGPGSFTGLKVGLSIVKGLALQESKPVIPVSTLLALATNAPKQGLVCPILDARRAEVYAAVYERRGDDLISLIPEGVFKPDVFFKEVTGRSQKRPLYFLGTGVRKYEEILKLVFGLSAVLSSPEFDQIRASQVGKIAYGLYQRGMYSKGGAELIPHYLRASEAELQRLSLDKS